MSQVKVSVLGGTVKVNAENGFTASDVIAAAAKELGVNIDPTQVAVIINGRQVEKDTPINDGDEVAAAPKVANG